MSEGSIAALIAAVLSFIATIYGHIRVSRDNRDKTIEAVRHEVSAIREGSEKADMKMGADFALFKSDMNAQISAVHQEVSTLRVAVEKHNGVIERVFDLEKSREVIEEKQRVANHRIDDLEKKVDAQ